MRIGIDCRTMLNPIAGEKAGVGHYTFHLVEALLAADRTNEYVLYFSHRMPREIANYFRRPNVRTRWLPLSRYGRYLPFVYSHMLLSAVLGSDRLDVFHATANIMPLTYPGKTVVTLHDLAIYKHPEWFPSQQVSTRILVPQSLRKANHVIAVSEATKRDAQKQFGIPADRISVVYEAADTKLLKLKDRHLDIRSVHGLPEKYVLFVGTLEPRKNISGLLRAWQRLRATNSIKAALVIAGSIGYRGIDIEIEIEKLGIKNDVHYLGYIPHNHKVQLLESATAFVFPSLYEGFGLPVLEAMQLGTPVITSDNSSLPEVTGKAAILVEPEDIQALSTQLRRVLTQSVLRRKLSQAGQVQAKKFSWAKAAQQTRTIYHQVAKT